MLAQGGERVHQFADRPEGNPDKCAMGITNDSSSVDHEHAATRQIHHAEHAVGAVNGFVSVGKQRELESVLGGELLVARYVLGGDTKHLRRHTRELRQLHLR